MSNISINLSANTASYTKRLRQAKTDTDRNLIQMEKKFEQFGKTTSDSLGSINGSLNTMTSALSGLKGGGYAVGMVVIGAAVAGLATSAYQASVNAEKMDKQIKAAASTAGMSVQEFVKMQHAVEALTVVTGDQLTDMFKDFKDKIGDFITTGAGPFVDFFDVVGAKSKITATELQNMSGKEGLQTVVKEMENAGASTAQMVFVLESLGNDASKLLPILRSNSKALKEWESIVDRISSKSLLSPKTAEEIKLANIATDEMNKSVGVLVATLSKPFIIGWSNFSSGVTKKVDEFISELTKDERKKFHLDVISSNVDFKSMSTNDIENALFELRQERALLEEKANKPWVPGGDMLGGHNPKHYQALLDSSQERFETTEKILEAEKKIKQLQESSLGSKSLEYTKNNTGLDTSEIDNKIKNEKDLIDKITALNKGLYKEKESIAMKASEAVSLTEKNTNYRLLEQTQKNIDENVKLQELAIKKEEDLQRQKTAIVLGYESKRQQELADLMKRGTAKELADHDAKLNALKAQKASDNLSNHHYNLLKEKLEEEHQDRLKVIELENQASSLAGKELAAKTELDKLKLKHDKQKVLLEKSIAEGQYLEQDEDIARKSLLSTQQEEMFRYHQNHYTSVLELAKTHTMDRLSTLGLGHTIELEQLKTKFGAEYETNEEYGIALQILANNQAREKLELERTIAQERLEWKAEHTSDEQEQINVQHELEMKELDQQLEDKLIKESEYILRGLDLKRAKLDAERDLATERLDLLGDELVSLQNNLEEGSKARKIAFAAEKAAAIASVGINMYDTAEAVKKAASPAGAIPAEIAYHASLANSMVSMGKMAATAIGQFHSGTDEVDQTGSYILKQGERVVQQAANKDLTNFLNSNASKEGGGTTIQSDLVIQGDKKLTDAEFEGYLAKHRESLTKFMKLAQRENPSLR
ncbi:hypothetical protein RA178_06305 [Shewanella oncorhynchi]|uniref:Uncharacterized protein n=1 Tax=Shewanella oncorhynchi TaxID=2726434 RepID=A0AA50KG01_9GAMM|nr:hypothetical protein [Shewanella oncorhynchi]WMB74224.1 hypothetical protein RA178_06305 [Shewanella oncorhynchi]